MSSQFPPDGPAPEPDSAIAASHITRNARYGIVLFLIYLAFYAGFVGLNAFAPERMKAPVPWLGGVNFAIAFGMGLIILALILAAIYLLLCRGSVEAPGEGEE